MRSVFVGLSGGVDSATAAHVLIRKGFDVTGVFIRGWEPDFLPCTGAADRLEAMRAAAHLGIPFRTYDLEAEYKREVVNYFVQEYREGRTPNPDVMCNRMIKFGAFWKRAHEEGADFIATGHYAINKVSGESLQLSASKDTEKDQTYFLWTLTQDDLSHTLFPVGGMVKGEVRKLAKKAGLPNAERKDSQGLCFLGHVDMRQFLMRYLQRTEGEVLDEEGRTIGYHDGAWFYTLGEHLPIGGFKKRLYVVGKDVVKNTLIVAENVATTGKTSYMLTHTNFISGEEFSGDAYARYRYRDTLIPVSIRAGVATFTIPQLIAPGQSLVVYDKNGPCLGGGVVSTVL